MLLEKPKRCYSRKKKVKSNLKEKFKAAIDDKNDKHLLNDPISEMPSLRSRKEDGHYPSCSKLSADKKNRLLSLNPKFNIRNRPEGLSTSKTMSNNLIQTETTTPELGEFVKNAVETIAVNGEHTKFFIMNSHQG
uniref:Uncharacterized protein n=1 Tax=Glossina pallidipes TaxID=7398 RepID=A0A1A9ZCP6_GLOPL